MGSQMPAHAPLVSPGPTAISHQQIIVHNCHLHSEDLSVAPDILFPFCLTFFLTSAHDCTTEENGTLHHLSVHGSSERRGGCWVSPYPTMEWWRALSYAGVHCCCALMVGKVMLGTDGSVSWRSSPSLLSFISYPAMFPDFGGMVHLCPV